MKKNDGNSLTRVPHKNKLEEKTNSIALVREMSEKLLQKANTKLTLEIFVIAHVHVSKNQLTKTK